MRALIAVLSSWKWGNKLRTGAIVRSMMAIAFVLGIAGIGAASPAVAGIPSCTNYVDQEKWGKVTVDLRPGGRGWGLSVWWIVDPPDARPGSYQVTHLVNNRAIMFDTPTKDDAYHTFLYQSVNGRTYWNYGDHYKLQGTHWSTSQKSSYVAVMNECVITTR